MQATKWKLFANLFCGAVLLALLLACSGLTTTKIDSSSQPVPMPKIEPEPSETPDPSAELQNLEKEEVGTEPAEPQPADPVPEEKPTPEPKPDPEPSPAVNRAMEKRIPAAIMDAAFKFIEGKAPFADGVSIGAVGPIRGAEVLVVNDEFVQVRSGDELFFIEGLDPGTTFVGESYSIRLVMITGRTNFETLLGQNSGWLCKAIPTQTWTDAVSIAKEMNAEIALSDMKMQLQEHQAALEKEAPVETWSDTSGSFTVDARFVAYDGKLLTIHRVDLDQEVTVPADKLSESSRSLAFDRAKEAGRHRREIQRLQKLIDKNGP